MTHPHSPEISILLPTYNGDRFLAKQLDSILSQSFSNFELLIIDDGSTDSTVAIIESYVQVDPRIEVLPSEGNRGHKSRLVELIDRSSAPFIAISDQDDIWHRDKLKRLTAALGTASLAFGRSDLIDAEGNRLNRTLLDVLRRPRRPGDRLSLLFRPQVSGHAMLARREIFSKTAFDSSEPYDWLISLLAEFSGGIVYDENAIVWHRIHSTNSHNGSVGLRLNLLQIRPRDLLAALKGARARPRRFVERLDFLAVSGEITEFNRALFQDLSRLCRDAWLKPGTYNGRRDSGLQQTLLKRLRPLSGSAGDWCIVRDHVTNLVSRVPLSIIRLRSWLSRQSP